MQTPSGTFPTVRLIEGVRRVGVCYKGKCHEEANFGTRLSVRLIEVVRLSGGPLNRGFTVPSKLMEVILNVFL